MKVKELIAALLALDPELLVRSAGNDGMSANIKEVFVGRTTKDGTGFTRNADDESEADTVKTVILLDVGDGSEI